MDKAQERKKKRQYGRKEKDSSNVWLIVTAAEDGKSMLWQRNMELLKLFLVIGDVEYVEVEANAMGLATDLARVYHSKGGKQHKCYQVQATPDTALWIDEALFYTKAKPRVKEERVDVEAEAEKHVGVEVCQQRTEEAAPKEMEAGTEKTTGVKEECENTECLA